MKALCFDKYGPPEVVYLGEIAKPVPKDYEIQVRVHATTVSTADWRIRSVTVPSVIFWPMVRILFGVFGPRKKILGTECAGVVEAAGAKVTRFKIGDEVFVSMGTKFGAHAEYVVVAENGLVAMKPANLNFEQASALCFGGLTALYFLRDLGKIKSGSKVLVIGASGAIGTFAVQLAKVFNAEVAGVCSAKNVELVKSLGANRVFDYTKEDFTKSGETYDIILDTVGKSSFTRCKRSLTDKGRFLAVVLGLSEITQIASTSFSSGKKVLGGVTVETAADMNLIRELAESKKIKPVIGQVLPFANAVEAHRLVDSGHKVGNVVLSLAGL